jgi:hypothetical protein
MYIYIYITRLASNEILSPSNKIHREVSRAKDLSASLYRFIAWTLHISFNVRLQLGVMNYVTKYEAAWRTGGRAPSISKFRGKLIYRMGRIIMR